MGNQSTSYKIREQLRISIKQTLPDLLKFKKEEDTGAFYDLLLEIVPDVRKYIVTRIKTALQKNHFPKNKYVPDDFIDQLFIETYDHIEKFSNEDEFIVWLYNKTNELLEDTIVEEEFDEFFFKNIDNYSKPEWDMMQENYSTDGGEDLLMIEELDDMSYKHNEYNLNHVFIENTETALIAKIDKNLKAADIQNHIKMVLYNLPLDMRTIFELHTKQHLELKEIAQIRNNTLEYVEQLLKDAKKALQVSLFNRYPIN
jgi:DNA-directed RNA polymerase specialized sigma24 family protein